MTAAICLNCGEFKFGAWTPCRKCGHVPTDEEDRAKHLIVTDHYLSQADLKSVGKNIKDGKQPQFSPEQIEQFKDTLRTAQPVTESDGRRLRLGCIFFVAAILSIIAWLAMR